MWPMLPARLVGSAGSGPEVPEGRLLQMLSGSSSGLAALEGLSIVDLDRDMARSVFCVEMAPLT